MTDLLRIVDFVRDGLLVCDAAGRVLHANAALARALDAEPERDRLRREIEAIARSAASLASKGDGATRGGVREVSTAARAYRVRAEPVGEGIFGPGVAVLVALEPLPSEPFPDEVLRERFGLTRTEVRVARLLAARRSNAEIAAELCLSPHTVRHHTEHVLDKLGVQSRTQVGPAMLRAGGFHGDAT